MKPAAVVLNTNEDAASSWPELISETGSLCPYPHTAAAAVAAQFEAEASLLEPEEAREFLQSSGISGTALERVSRAFHQATETILVYTCNLDQAQAWRVARGSTAIEFAETIHSDIARGFIRAETISHAGLVQAGSYAEARRHGAVRSEGRDYVLRDGDVVEVLFSR